MMFRLVVLLAVLALTWGTKRDSEELKTIVNEDLPLPDFVALRAYALSPDAEPWHHTSDLFFAIHNGKSEYTVVESVKDTTGWDFSNYEELKTRALHETTTSYKLLNNADSIISLDQSQHTTAVKEIGEAHITHCAFTGKVGDHVIGSSHGAWFMQASPKQGMYAAHKDGTSHSIVLARRVLSMTVGADNCHTLTTETVHPLELFESMNVESRGTRPFHEISLAEAKEMEQEQQKQKEASRHLQVANPDPPLVACSKFTAPVGTKYAGPGSAGGVSYSIGSSAGCLQYNYDVGSVAMNYNWNTKSAVSRNLLIATGLTCRDCYLYTGAGFLAIGQYVTRQYFRMEVKVSGGAGFKLNMFANNPTLQASKTFNILSAGSWSTINLGAGLAFQYQMGGVRIDVSGSGTAVGGGTVVAGAEAQASAGMVYSASKMTYPVSAFKSFTTPKVALKFTSLKPLSAMVIPTGRLNVKLTFGGAVGSVTGHMDFSAMINFDYKTSSMTSLSAFVGLAAEASAEARALEGQRYTPGMKVPVTISYKGFYPNEEHHAFYSVTAPNGQEIRVMDQKFTTSNTGTGTYTAHWTVPSDSYFAPQNGNKQAHFNVRVSNLHSRSVKSSPFTLDVYNPSEGVVAYPSAGSVVPTDVPVTVKWDASKLHYFKGHAMSAMHGYPVQSRHVVFECTGEKLQGGKVIDSRSTRHLISGSVDNLGQATIMFPSSFAKRFDRFYLEVHDKTADSVGGWNAGYFTLSSPATAVASAKATPNVATEMKVLSATKLSLRHATVAQPVVAAAAVAAPVVPVVSAEEEARALAGCSSGFYWGFGVTFMGAVDYMTILLWDVPLGYASSVVNLMPVKVYCV